MKLGLYFDIRPSLWCISSECSGETVGRDMHSTNLISFMCWLPFTFRLLSSALEVLDGAFAASSADEKVIATTGYIISLFPGIYMSACPLIFLFGGTCTPWCFHLGVHVHF